MLWWAALLLPSPEPNAPPLDAHLASNVGLMRDGSSLW